VTAIKEVEAMKVYLVALAAELARA